MKNSKSVFKLMVAIAVFCLSSIAGAITLKVGSLSTDSVETRATAVENVLINFLNRFDSKLKKPDANLAKFSVQYMDLYVEDAAWIGGTQLSPKVRLTGNLRYESPSALISGKWGPHNHQNRKLVRRSGLITPMMVDDYDEYEMETDFWDEYYNADSYYGSLNPAMGGNAACIASCEMGYLTASSYCRGIPSVRGRGLCWAGAAAVYGACLASC